MRQASLKQRLVFSVTALVTVMTVVMVVIFLSIGNGVLSGVADRSVHLSDNTLKKQRDAMVEVQNDVGVQAFNALSTKATNQATLYARLAVTPMSAFDYETLNENASLLYADEDVLLCYAMDPSGKILTFNMNEQNPRVKKTLGEFSEKKATIEQLADSLRKNAVKSGSDELKESSVIVVETPINPGKDRKGTAVVLVSASKAHLQKQSLVGKITQLETSLTGAFGQFKKDLDSYKVTQAKDSAIHLGIAAAVMIVIMVLVVIAIANSIAKPINTAVKAAEQVAAGDLTAKIEVPEEESKSETGQLLCAIHEMTCNLNSLVSQVKHSSIQLVSTATGIASNVKQQQSAVSDFGSSTTEIAAAAKQISATSRELLQTMNGVATTASDTATLADTGRGNLREMEGTIGQLGQATQSISSKLSAIREKADEINVVVTTITKVADQTNLLSLNASIEAEKAGEYGLGFAVVAREIRRLADQTAVATLDIEQMVKEMQGAVSAGVMEMDRFARDVQRGVDEVGRIGTQQGAIIERVQTLLPRFKQVNEGMEAQAQGATQISDAMIQLNDGAQRTISTLDEFSKASTDLYASVNSLKEEVARFRINA